MTTRSVIIGNGDCGLCYGEIDATDEEIVRTRAVRVSRCRHIGYWDGPKGGLTSLVELGPGPKSRIGDATTTPALVIDVKTVLEVSPIARAKFETFVTA